MANAKRALLAFSIAVIAVLIGIALGVRLAGLFRSGNAARTYNTPALLQQVQSLSELVTVKYVIEKVEILEIPSEKLVGQMIGSKNRVLLLAHGIVKAGVDFQKLTPEDIQTNGRSILIKLPAAQITDAYLDERQTQVIDRTTGLLAPPDKDLEQTARQNAVLSIRYAALKNGILKDAEERARKQIAALLLQSGFDRVEFQLADGSSVRATNPFTGGTSEKPGP